MESGQEREKPPDDRRLHPREIPGPTLRSSGRRGFPGLLDGEPVIYPRWHRRC